MTKNIVVFIKAMQLQWGSLMRNGHNATNPILLHLIYDSKNSIDM